MYFREGGGNAWHVLTKVLLLPNPSDTMATFEPRNRLVRVDVPKGSTLCCCVIQERAGTSKRS